MDKSRRKFIVEGSIVFAALPIALAACGGGGNSLPTAKATPTPTPQPTPTHPSLGSTPPATYYLSAGSPVYLPSGTTTFNDVVFQGGQVIAYEPCTVNCHAVTGH